MTNQHLIIPPPELVQEWLCSDDYLWGPLEQKSMTITTNRLQNVAAQAAQWGADAELNYCCDELSFWGSKGMAERLRSDRRPKPPSLKEQALLVIDTAVADDRLSADVANIVRRALEALDA